MKSHQKDFHIDRYRKLATHPCSKKALTDGGGGGLHSTMDSIHTFHPVAPGLILRNPKSFSENLGRNNLMSQRFLDSPA